MRLDRWNYRSIILLWLIGSLLGSAHVWGRSFPATGDPALAAQQRWGASMQGYITLGCLHSVSASTSVSMPNCRGFVLDDAAPPILQGFEDLTARTITYSGGDGTYWLVVRSDLGVVPSSYTCVAGTHYCWLKNSTEPASYPAKTMLIGVITVSGNAITAVGDLRSDSPGTSQEVNAMSPMFGVAGDCTTDDTAALQVAINNAAWRDKPLYIPTTGRRRCYNITRLWFVHDATNNPRFPPDLRDQASFRVYGDGMSALNNTVSNEYGYTVFESTETTNPIFNAQRPCATFAGLAFRAFRLERLAIIANNSNFVIDIECMNSFGGLEDILIEQRHINGSGIRFNDTYLTTVRNVIVDNESVGVQTGTGFEMRNFDVSGAGLITIDQLTAKGFSTGIRLGSDWDGATPNVSNITCISCQAIDNQTINIDVAYATVVFINMWSEACVGRGLWVRHSGNVIVLGGRFTTINTTCTAHIQTGDSTLAADNRREALRVSLHHLLILDVMLYGIYREFVGPDAEYWSAHDVTIAEATAPPGNTIAIEFGTVQTQRAVVSGLHFLAFEAGDTEISNGKWVNFLQDAGHIQIQNPNFNVAAAQAINGANLTLGLDPRAGIFPINPTGVSSVRNIAGTYTGPIDIWEGAYITIINSGANALTIQHNGGGTGNIRAFGAVDLVLATNDSATCIWRGASAAIWNCR